MVITRNSKKTQDYSNIFGIAHHNTTTRNTEEDSYFRWLL